MQKNDTLLYLQLTFLPLFGFSFISFFFLFFVKEKYDYIFKEENGNLAKNFLETVVYIYLNPNGNKTD